MDVLKKHADDLNDDRLAEVLGGLIRVREYIREDEDFQVLIRSISRNLPNDEKHLALAQVYWSYTYIGGDTTEKWRRSLSHFIDHAIAMQGKISDATSRDMQSIIKILIKRGDKYLAGNSDRIMTLVQPTMAADYLDELIRFRNDWPDFHTAAVLQQE